MNKLLEIKNLNMSFEKKGGFLKGVKRIEVLRDIDLTIGEGEIVAVVGESGCGKTTVGKIITGLLKPTSGEVLFEDKNLYSFNLTGAQRTRELVQFVQQDSYAALNPVNTIWHSMLAPVQHHYKHISQQEAENKIKEIFVTVGLTPPELFLEKYPHMLSGGQRQRILMARAISLEPKLIVADEPVSMIDVSMRLSILNMMCELNEKFGISFVYITHDLATAKYIAKNGSICVMYLGEIVEYGKVSDILTNPRHPYTQALLSAVPVPDPSIAKCDKPIPIKSMDVSSLENRSEGCVFFDRCPYAQEICRQKISYTEGEGGTRVKCCRTEEIPAWTR